MAVNISWFPGHMNKARIQVQEKLQYIDIVIELVDARLPLSSRNPLLDKIIGDKPRLILLNKRDLADEKISKEWQDYFAKQGIKAILTDAKEQSTTKRVTQAAQEVLKEKLERAKARGIQNKAIRAIVVGIPNVGKSTLMNRLAGKKIAITGNKPGVTKGQQWLKTNKDLEILDTPGILWPKFEDESVGLKLGLTGAIKDDNLPMDDVTIFGLDYFKAHYPQALRDRYKMNDAMFEWSTVDLIIELTKKLGFRDDYDRFYTMFVKDVRDGRLGTYTLDRVEDLENDENN
jgi:ribosome biogenesis GTPase A